MEHEIISDSQKILQMFERMRQALAQAKPAPITIAEEEIYNRLYNRILSEIQEEQAAIEQDVNFRTRWLAFITTYTPPDQQKLDTLRQRIGEKQSPATNKTSKRGN